MSGSPRIRRKPVETYDLPLNDDGTVALFHATPSLANAKRIVAEKMLRSAAEPSVYLSTASEGTGYGSHVVGVHVHPQHLEIDDEFPDGRRDFRIDRKTAPVTRAWHHTKAE